MAELLFCTNSTCRRRWRSYVWICTEIYIKHQCLYSFEKDILLSRIALFNSNSVSTILSWSCFPISKIHCKFHQTHGWFSKIFLERLFWILRFFSIFLFKTSGFKRSIIPDSYSCNFVFITRSDSFLGGSNLRSAQFLFSVEYRAWCDKA